MDTEAEKSVIYGSRRPGFIEGEKTNFDVGLNCTTQQANFTELARRRIQFNPGIAASLSFAHYTRTVAAYPKSNFGRVRRKRSAQFKVVAGGRRTLGRRQPG
jgi:hypothetical protein